MGGERRGIKIVRGSRKKKEYNRMESRRVVGGDKSDETAEKCNKDEERK